MATQTFDFSRVELPDIEDAPELFGAWLHSFMFGSTVNLAGIGDDILVLGRVPTSEDWQVLQIQVNDLTAAVNPQGWQSQAVELKLPYGAALASAAVPQPTGPMQSVVPQYGAIWRRMWDGVTFVEWTDAPGNALIIRPCDPVFSVHRWPGGTLWRLQSLSCEAASGGVKQFQVFFVVLRMRRGAVGLDPFRPLAGIQALLRAVQSTARGQALTE